MSGGSKALAVWPCLWLAHHLPDPESQMIDPAILLPYVAACLLFAIVPGPSVTVVVANSLARGTRAGLLTILGTEIAMFTMVFIVAVGLDAVMTLVSEAFTIIKLAGAAYLVWIGFKMFTSSGKLEMGTPGEKLPLGRYIWQGCADQLVQPQDAAVPRRVPAAVHRHEPAPPSSRSWCWA